MLMKTNYNYEKLTLAKIKEALIDTRVSIKNPVEVTIDDNRNITIRGIGCFIMGGPATTDLFESELKKITIN